MKQADMRTSRSKKNHSVHPEENQVENLTKRSANKNETKKLLFASFAVSLLFFLPYMTDLHYAIDDYHLFQLYNINWANLGYNFAYFGRYLEGGITQLMYLLNLQPITKPLGPLLFISSLCSLGLYLTKRFNIASFSASLAFILLLSTNPFFSELYHYSIVPFYSGLAVFALLGGLYFGNMYLASRKRYYLVLSLLFYISSLSIYQIFYPILLFAFFYQFLMLPSNDVAERKKCKTSFGLYLLSVVSYYVLLMIGSIAKPVENNASLWSLTKKLFSVEYWGSLLHNTKIFTFENNPFNSMMINIILWAFCLIVFCLSVWKESADFPIEICRRRFILGFLLILICGPMLCMGFDLIRLSNISSRSYTAFGIYEAVLLLMLFRVYHPDNVKIKRIAFGLLAVLILVGNIGLIGRSAMNQSRLNRTESSLITRIIYRMEQMPDFKPTTPLVVAGQPTLGQIGTTGFADFNLPATGQFSRTFAFNEVSGYSFTYPSPENNETAEKYLKTMTAWPSANSVKFVDGIFIVKLS